jgi:hypothetical protein
MRGKGGAVRARGMHRWEEKEKGKRREWRWAARPFYTDTQMLGMAGEGVPRGRRGRGWGSLARPRRWEAGTGLGMEGAGGQRAARPCRVASVRQDSQGVDVWAPATMSCGFNCSHGLN